MPLNGPAELSSPITSVVTPWRILLERCRPPTGANRSANVVDEARGDDQAARVDLALRFACPGANAHNPILVYGDIAIEPGIASAIDNPPIADDEVVFRLGGQD